MKFKKLFGLTLIGILAFSTINAFASADIVRGSVSVVANEHSDAVQTDTEHEFLNLDKPTTWATNLVISEPLSGVRGSATYSFSLSSSQLHYRVYIENTGSSSYAVTVGGNSFTVQAGKSVTKVYSAKKSSKRSVDITSKDGSALEGTIAVRIAESLDDLQ